MLDKAKTRKHEYLMNIFGHLADFFKTNILTKLIFFSIGVIIWFNINLQNDFEASVNIPILITNIQRGKTLHFPVPDEARIKIRSKGRNLLFSELGRDVFFEIDASGVSDSIVIRLNSDYFVNTSGKEIEPLFIFHPHEVNIRLDDLAQKKVPLILNSGFTLAAGYVVSGKFTLQPESVVVSGPAKVVEKILSVGTERKTENGLTADYSREIPLVLQHHPIVSYSSLKASAYQKIVRKGSNTFKAPVIVENKPQDKSILIDPVAIDITVIGPVNELQDIGSGNFTVKADVADLDNITNRMPLSVSSDISHEWSYTTKEVRAIIY